MNISEMICQLQAVKCEHGDLPVMHAADNFYLRPVKLDLDAADDGRKLAVMIGPVGDLPSFPSF